MPGHVHLKDLGQLVAREIEKAGGVAKEFNTIAVDDGIAMGHDGMLYSLPSREIIGIPSSTAERPLRGRSRCHLQLRQDHARHADGLAAPRHPFRVRVGRPDGSRQGQPDGKLKTLDLVDAMVAAADEEVTDEELQGIERSACPTCGSCSGMFTANSMVSHRGLGLALPGNGTVLATHAERKRLFVEAGHLAVDLVRRCYEQDDASVQPRSIATFEAFENAMILDIAMGGSTNTVLHLLAAAHEAEVDFTMADIDRLSAEVPVLCKVAPAVADVHIEDVHRAGGIMGILGELDRAGLIRRDVGSVHAGELGRRPRPLGRPAHRERGGRSFYQAAPGGCRRPSLSARTAATRSSTSTARRASSAMRRPRLLEGRRSRGAKGQPGRGRMHREDGGRGRGISSSPARRGCSRARTRPCRNPGRRREGGRRRGDPLRRPARRTGMQEMLYPTSYLKSKGSAKPAR